MSQFLDCVNAQEAKDGLSPQWKKVFQETYDAHFQGFKNNFGEEAADKMAGKAALDEVAMQIKRQRYLVHLQKVKRIELVNNFEKYQAMDVKTPFAKMAAGMTRLAEHLGGRMGAPFSSLEGRRQAIVSTAQTMMSEFIEKFEAGMDANLVMTRNKALMDNILDEFWGVDTGDGSAKALVGSIGDTLEYLRQRLNLAGANVAKLKNYRIPQSHNQFLLRRADVVLKQNKKHKNAWEALKRSKVDIATAKQAWIDFTKPLLNTENMIDSATNMPFSPEALDFAMSKMFDRINTDGAIDLKPGEAMKPTGGASAFEEHRFLDFKDAASWKKYHSHFGDGEPFAMVMNHIDSMAREISMMEILGPRPLEQWQWLKNEALRRAALENNQGFAGADDKAKFILNQADRMFNLFNGSQNELSSEAVGKHIYNNVSGYLTGVQLGGAIISDIVSAPVLGFFARAFTGLSKRGDFSRIMKMLFVPGDIDYNYAKRAVFINDAASNALINKAYHAQRYLGSSIGERLPDLIFKWNWQQQFTSSRKYSFGMEFMGALDDIKGHAISTLEKMDEQSKALARTLKNWGFTPEEWDLIRKAPSDEPREGVKFLRMQDVADYLRANGIDERQVLDLSSRYGEMIQMEAMRAVPEQSLYAKAQTAGRLKDSDGLFSMIVRSMTKYRSFTVTMSHYWGGELHTRRIQDGWRGVGTSAAFFSLLTISGAAAMQMKEIAKGNTPRGDYNKLEFWMAAVLQSGGLGILGDFFTAAKNRAGVSSTLAALGPMGTLINDVGGLVNDTSRQYLGIGLEDDAKPNPGKKAVNLIARNVPWSSLWYLRAAWDRGVIAHLRNMFDPNSDKYWQRYKKNLDDQEQDYWWKPAGEADLDYLMHHLGGVEEAAD